MRAYALKKIFQKELILLYFGEIQCLHFILQGDLQQKVGNGSLKTVRVCNE